LLSEADTNLTDGLMGEQTLQPWVFWALSSTKGAFGQQSAERNISKDGDMRPLVHQLSVELTLASARK